MKADTGVTRSFGAGEESVEEAVVRAVADVKRVSPLELDTRLYEVVDPDALNALFRSRPGNPAGPAVRLTLDGCHVAICDGEVTATRPVEAATGTAERAVE